MADHTLDNYRELAARWEAKRLHALAELPPILEKVKAAGAAGHFDIAKAIGNPSELELSHIEGLRGPAMKDMVLRWKLEDESIGKRIPIDSNMPSSTRTAISDMHRRLDVLDEYESWKEYKADELQRVLPTGQAAEGFFAECGAQARLNIARVPEIRRDLVPVYRSKVTSSHAALKELDALTGQMRELGKSNLYDQYVDHKQAIAWDLKERGGLDLGELRRGVERLKKFPMAELPPDNRPAVQATIDSLAQHLNGVVESGCKEQALRQELEALQHASATGIYSAHELAGKAKNEAIALIGQETEAARVAQNSAAMASEAGRAETFVARTARNAAAEGESAVARMSGRTKLIVGGVIAATVALGAILWDRSKSYAEREMDRRQQRDEQAMRG